MSENPDIPDSNSQEKVLCQCGKSISKKNLSVHLKTAAHINSVNPIPEHIPIPSAPIDIPSKPIDGQLKIKQRFDELDEKLEHILDILVDLEDAILGPEDDDPSDVQK